MTQAYRLTAWHPAVEGGSRGHHESVVVPGTNIQDALAKFTARHPNAGVQNIQHIGRMFEESEPA